MTHLPFRFGVTFAATGDATAWAGAARRAQDRGYSTVLLPDTTRTPAPLPALAVAAAATDRLRIGTWVLCDPLHNPRQLAWEVRTLQELTGGRFELGIGAGRPEAGADCSVLDVPFGSPAERVDRLARSLAVLRGQLPGTHLLVAAAGPKLLSLAARLADTVAFGWPPQTDVAAARGRIATVTAAAGDRADALELAAGLIAAGDGEHPWLARLGTDQATLARQDAVTVVTGSPRQMADTLQRRRDELGISYLTVPASDAETFAPVVAALAGR